MGSSIRRRTSGITLLEVLVTLAILLAIMLVVIQFMTDIDQAWKSAAADPYAESLDAFETIARNLASATLEPYEDYADTTGAFRTNSATAFVPDHLARRSDLDFVCGPSSGSDGLLTASGRVTTGSAVFFLAPRGYTQTLAHQGMGHLLNAMGYYVEFGDDTSVPSFVTPQIHTWRWRLKQVLQPAESLQIFAVASSAAWIQPLAQSGASSPILAENIVTLLVLPELAADDANTPLSPGFAYDSRDSTSAATLSQLPPRIRLVLVAMDPGVGQHLAMLNGANAPALVPGGLFQQSAQLDSDLATLDASLTAQKIGHRIFQRTILLPASTWTDSPSPP